jgi:vesicle coat complex subunit
MRTASQINKTIKAIAASAGKLQDKIHACAMECLEHAEAHGDATLIDNLIKALPNGQRVTTLREWVQEFTPVRWNKDGEVALISKKSKLYEGFKLDQAKDLPYYAWAGAEKSTKPLTLEALMNLVRNLDKRIDKAVEKENIDGDVEEMRGYVRLLADVKPGPRAIEAEKEAA